MDNYKIEQIEEMIQAIDDGEIYHANLKGNGKTINIDKNALKHLQEYYNNCYDCYMCNNTSLSPMTKVKYGHICSDKCLDEYLETNSY